MSDGGWSSDVLEQRGSSKAGSCQCELQSGSQATRHGLPFVWLKFRGLPLYLCTPYLPSPAKSGPPAHPAGLRASRRAGRNANHEFHPSRASSPQKLRCTNFSAHQSTSTTIGTSAARKTPRRQQGLPLQAARHKCTVFATSCAPTCLVVLRKHPRDLGPGPDTEAHAHKYNFGQ